MLNPDVRAACRNIATGRGTDTDLEVVGSVRDVQSPVPAYRLIAGFLLATATAHFGPGEIATLLDAGEPGGEAR